LSGSGSDPTRPTLAGDINLFFYCFLSEPMVLVLMVPDGNAWQVIIQARFGVLFQDAALASDYQVFATRVTRGPLDVQSISAEKAVTA
jgi:hypothetical protein